MQESPEREATEQKASSSLRPIRVKNGEKVLTLTGLEMRLLVFLMTHVCLQLLHVLATLGEQLQKKGRRGEKGEDRISTCNGATV